MDQGNLAILVDAKFEYTKQLINILKNNIFQGIKRIYINAKEYSIEHDETDRILKKFQFYLSEIPKWNQEMILKEVTEILDKSKCDWLEELITAVFVSHTRILTSINTAKSKKKINLNIPKIDHFIHQCYIDTARAFWKTPYLFDDTLNNYEYQRNRRDAEGIIETSIQETIRKQLPVKHILKEYLGKDYDTDNEEDIESEDYSNLRKMVKAEIENCSKEQLLGTTDAAATKAADAAATEATEANEAASATEAAATDATKAAATDAAAAEATEATEATEAAEPSNIIDTVTEKITSEVELSEPQSLEEIKSEVLQTETPTISENNLSMQVTETKTETDGMKIETLDLDNVDSLEDLTKLDLTEVDVKHPENEIINLDSIEGLDTLDNELSQVDMFGGNNTGNEAGQITQMDTLNEPVSLNETPTLEKDVSNIKKIVIKTSELNDEDRKKKEVLRKYGRKKNFNFFNDSVESDDDF